MSLPESLERAASELDDALADRIRPANGDPHRLLAELDEAGARALLAWMLEHEPDAGAELIAAWDEDERGARVLLGMSESGLPKGARKLLRKAHHRLRSRGLDVRPPAPAAPSPSGPRKRVAEEDRWQAAYVSPPDFRGARLAYLGESHPAGGARLFEVRFEPGRGLHDFKVYNAGRSKVRGFLRSMSTGAQERLLPVEGTALRAAIRGAALDQPADRPLPTAYVEWRSRLFSEELEKESTPGELARAALGDDGDADAGLARVAEDVTAGRIGPWPPPTAWVGDWMERGRGAVEGLEGAARSEALEAWLEQAANDLAETGDPALLARHLEELAWVRWQGERTEEARGLLAAARAVTTSADGRRRLARARAESLFEPFLKELRSAEATASDAVESAG